MKNYVIYHNKDLDGFCSGAIAKRWLLSKGETDITMVGYNYGDGPLLERLEVKADDRVILTDLSLEDDDMQIMLSLQQSLWIDHHKSAIDKSREQGWSAICGSRKDGDSASLLAWQYFFPKEDMPAIVYYVDRYDVYKNSNDSDWDKILMAQQGLRLNLNDPENEEDFDLWNMYLDNWSIEKHIKAGSYILRYIDKENERVAQRAYPVKLGDHIVACVNYDRPDIKISDYIKFDHQGIAFLTYYKNKVTFSLRKKKSQKADILSMAKEMGGGGHECACGFVMTLHKEEEFRDFAEVLIFSNNK